MTVAVALGVAWAGWIWLLRPWIVEYGVAIHQRNVTKELAKWGDEESRITDDASAVRAAEMVDYISRYYVPGPGYRGPADVEAALQAQRRRSIDQIVVSLERYTGLKFGASPDRWAEWAKKRKETMRPQ